MIACRIVLVGLALALGAVVVGALAAPTAQSRGVDELVYNYFGQAPFDSPGAVYEQDVPLQQAAVSELSIPYHLNGPASARVRISVTEPGGRVLLDESRDIHPTLSALPFQLVASYWDGQQSAWIRVPVSPKATFQSLGLRLERLDAGGGGFFFYTDPAAVVQRPPLKQNRDLALVVQTSYGPIKPALTKAPTYARRVGSLAPPWLRGPLPWILPLVLLALCAVLGREMLRPPRAPSSGLFPGDRASL